MYNRTILEDVKSTCNIVDVVGRVVELKKTGKNHRGLCPFHKEKTPSFFVTEQRQTYTCYGCNAHGDVINFVRDYYNLDFKEAVEKLAKDYNIPFDGFSKDSVDKEPLYKINELAAEFYARTLKETANPGYKYMQERGILVDTLNTFKIGYADEGWSSLYDYLKSQGVSESKMLELGLVSKSEKGQIHDKFRNRVMFPIFNVNGRVIGFSGRSVGNEMPKYMNSNESAVFKKKDNLYGLNITKSAVREKDYIILVEGNVDVMSLYQSGITNVSASLGTALTEQQANKIRRYTKNVVIAYDSDKAGQEATTRAIGILSKAECKIKVLTIPDSKDPDEFIKKNGIEAFNNLLKAKVPAGEYFMNTISTKYDLSENEQRAKFAEEATTAIGVLDVLEADAYVRDISKLSGLSETAVREKKRQISEEKSKRKPYPKQEQEDLDLGERQMLSVLLDSREIKVIPKELEDIIFTTILGKTIYKEIKVMHEKEEKATIKKLREILDSEEYSAALTKIDPENKINVVNPEDYDTYISIAKKKAREKERRVIEEKLQIAEEENDMELQLKTVKELNMFDKMAQNER